MEDLQSLSKEDLIEIIWLEKERSSNLSRQLRIWKAAHNVMGNPLDLNDRSSVEKYVVAGLKSAIHDHGPITQKNISSAGKRVYGKLKEIARYQRRER